MRVTRALSGAAFFALLLGACSDDTLPKYILLDGLRVVALVADSPDIAAGSTPTITPWVSDAFGGSRTLKAKATGCYDPGVSLGAEPSCDNSATARTLLAETAVTWPDSNDSTDRAGAASPTFQLQASDTTSILSGRSAVDKFNGVAYIVVYEVYTADGSARVKSFKRILVSDKSAVSGASRNANPTLSDILANGTSLSAYPSTAVSLSASLASGSAETYTTLRSDGSTTSLTESVATTWFISDGDMKYYRTTAASASLYTPATKPTSRTAFVLAVARDGRGGESALKRRMP